MNSYTQHYADSNQEFALYYTTRLDSGLIFIPLNSHEIVADKDLTGVSSLIQPLTVCYKTFYQGHLKNKRQLNNTIHGSRYVHSTEVRKFIVGNSETNCYYLGNNMILNENFNPILLKGFTATFSSLQNKLTDFHECYIISPSVFKGRKDMISKYILECIVGNIGPDTNTDVLIKNMDNNFVRLNSSVSKCPNLNDAVYKALISNIDNITL